MAILRCSVPLLPTAILGGSQLLQSDPTAIRRVSIPPHNNWDPQSLPPSNQFWIPQGRSTPTLEVSTLPSPPTHTPVLRSLRTTPERS